MDAKGASMVARVIGWAKAQAAAGERTVEQSKQRWDSWTFTHFQIGSQGLWYRDEDSLAPPATS